MKYWDCMRDPMGFIDYAKNLGIDELSDYGHAPYPYPLPVMQLYRDVYLKTVNVLARHHRSNVRAVPRDRPGRLNKVRYALVMRNWFEAEFLPAQSRAKQIAWYVTWKPVSGALLLKKFDWAFEAAVDDARKLDVDQYVNITATVPNSFMDLLAGIVKKPRVVRKKQI